MKRPRRWSRPLLVSLLLLAVARAGWCEPVVTLVENGDPANRVDLVLLGDGYTAEEMPRYAADVERIVRGFFSQEPFHSYQRYFNVHRIDLVSPESGADHPERRPPVFRNTALDATYNCSRVQRLICVNTAKVNAVLARSLPPARRDLVLVVVNDPGYGGSGGQFSVISTHRDAVELALHEMGHTLGLLADEYGGESGPACHAAGEPRAVNVTKETRPDRIKWRHWIEGSGPIPSSDSRPGVPGLYPGGQYCDVGIYRPTLDSKMRSLARPFEPVNSEQLIRRIYNWVSPIDASEPAAGELRLAPGQTQVFRVATPAPLFHALAVQWLVNGEPGGFGPEFRVSAARFPPGLYSVEAMVRDPTPHVRQDPAQVLTERRNWKVTIAAPSP